jgi:2-polyprenyl-3-methyl-5-hydroxy-6-metoxy-1,4-benzoquinol methylase
MEKGIYSDGAYQQRNPDWHMADSAWKAERIAAILERNSVSFSSCVEVGCGAGQVLRELARRYPGGRFTGYDVSPDAASFWTAPIAMSVEYQCADFTTVDVNADLLLLIDVFEHVEDYMGFLRKLSGRARWFVFHIPLDMHVSGLLRDRQMNARQQVGHLHYFSRATARATLSDTGYRIIDEELTQLSQETSEGRRMLTLVANLFRRSAQLVSAGLAARLLGGYSLLVLAEGSGR